MTILLEILAVAAVIFAALSWIAGRWTDGLTVAPPDSGSSGLPAGRLEPAAIDRARFGLAFRGYRMAEVDDALDRLRDELADRDAELAAARAAAPDPAPEPGAVGYDDPPLPFPDRPES